MLLFWPRFLRTFRDLPGYLSLLVHAWNGCNLRCFGCHNYTELIASPPRNALDADTVIERLGNAAEMFDAVLFSGGEFLVSPVKELESFLRRVRAVFPGRVVILTNGTFPEKLARLLGKDLIDGAHVDMKFPFHRFDPVADAERFRAVLGVAPSRRLAESVLRSVEIVVRHGSPYSQIRTVRYPILDDRHFDDIRAYVEKLKNAYKSDVPYFLNPYYEPEEASADVSNTV